MIFQRPQPYSSLTGVHLVQHPEMQISLCAAAQRSAVEFQPSETLLGPLAANGNALAQEADKPNGVAPVE